MKVQECRGARDQDNIGPLSWGWGGIESDKLQINSFLCPYEVSRYVRTRNRQLFLLQMLLVQTHFQNRDSWPESWIFDLEICYYSLLGIISKVSFQILSFLGVLIHHIIYFSTSRMGKCPANLFPQMPCVQQGCQQLEGGMCLFHRGLM